MRDAPRTRDQITYFRVCTTDDMQGPAGAAYAYTNAGRTQSYVIDDNETYGKGVADQWEREFKKLGGTVALPRPLHDGQQDFHALLTQHRRAHPDVVFFGGVTSTGGGLIRKQMPDAGLASSTTYAGADGIATINSSSRRFDRRQRLGDRGVGERERSCLRRRSSSKITKPSTTSPSARTPRTLMSRRWCSSMRSAKRSRPMAASAQPRAGARISSARPSAFPSIIGTFAFDPNGDTTNRIISFYEAVKDNWVFVAQLNFAGTA